jgi:ABC-2 type transport system ATP-binding protein
MTTSETRLAIEARGILCVRLADARDSNLARQVLGGVLGVPVTEDADPAVLTARIEGPSAAEGAARGLALLTREWVEVSGFSLGFQAAAESGARQAGSTAEG